MLDSNQATADVLDVLGEHGRLAEVISGFAPRDGQIEMATAVAAALNNRNTLIAEAGTGIGKTFAYLVPALQSGGKVIVSTGTRHLQDQLYKKDLPTLRKALRLSFNSALLKGRANYLCTYRLEQAMLDTRRGKHKHFHLLRALDDWRHSTLTGDRVEFTRLPEDHILWPRVTSTADNCLGAECPRYSECFVAKSRRAAHDADLVVINHHLFFADLALKENGFGELLPIAQGIILDEAHQLPNTASRFFGQMFSSRRVLDLCKDTLDEARTEAPDMDALFEAADQLPRCVTALRQAMGSREQRQPWLPMLRREHVKSAVTQLRDALLYFAEALDLAAERSQGLTACWRRATELLALLDSVNQPSDELVQWFETSRQGFALHCTPLNIADTFRKQIDMIDCAWIFTSATLAVGKDFSHFTRQLGIDDARSEQWQSPFDFNRQARVYAPEKLPVPNAPNFSQAMAEELLPILEANSGGSFLLFTSYRALREMENLLNERQMQRRLLVQGEMPRSELLEQFRNEGNAILLATSGFWEGVDVRGSALSCVVIDKLPFMPPDDPVTEARLSMLRQHNQNPFFSYQVPQAVIALKQGVGRLLRDVNDQGLIMLCDTRLFSKSYGKSFLESLPPAPVIRGQREAIEFLQAINKASEGNSLP